MLVPAGLWAALNAKALSGFISLSALGNLSNFRPAGHARRRPPHAPADRRRELARPCGRAADPRALALVGLARNARRASAWGFMMSAGLGWCYLDQPLRSEGSFAPRCSGSWLVIVGLASVRKPPWRYAGFFVVGIVLLGTFLVAQFGLDQTKFARRPDIAALYAFIAHAPPRSYRLELGDGTCR